MAFKKNKPPLLESGKNMTNEGNRLKKNLKQYPEYKNQTRLLTVLQMAIWRKKKKKA